MTSHPDIQRIAKLSFAKHVLTKAPARSWRMGEPGRSAYAFRITWAPGGLAVSGDIGSATYEVWPGFSSVWDAVEFVSHAGFEYFCEKGSLKTEFDRDATVRHLFETAYADLRAGYKVKFFKQICWEYGGDHENHHDREEAARAFCDDDGLTAERVYVITCDSEALIYSYPARARWTYEAARLWAETMLAQEPGWHRAWRGLKRWARRERYNWRSKRHFRPELYETANNFNGAKTWARLTFVCQGSERARMASVAPLRLLGLDLSRLGLWRETGSSWPLDGDQRDARFRPLTGARRP